jgi:hypothetical protein
MVYFLYPFIDLAHLGCFQSLATIKRISINMGMKVLLLYIDLHSFVYMLKSDMVGS